jgi:hypothetical protein
VDYLFFFNCIPTFLSSSKLSLSLTWLQLFMLMKSALLLVKDKNCGNMWLRMSLDLAFLFLGNYFSFSFLYIFIMYYLIWWLEFWHISYCYIAIIFYSRFWEFLCLPPFLHFLKELLMESLFLLWDKMVVTFMTQLLSNVSMTSLPHPSG